jgi:hypothetical protein
MFQIAHQASSANAGKGEFSSKVSPGIILKSPIVGWGFFCFVLDGLEFGDELI